MAKRQHIRRASAEQIEGMRKRGESRSDWQAAESMARADIERLADEDEGELPAGWESTVDVGLPDRRQAIHIRLDPEVLRWFKAHGPGYQTRIDAMLRAFVQAGDGRKGVDEERKMVTQMNANGRG